PPPLDDAVPGIAVLRENDSPPSAVSSTEPFLSSRKPVAGVMKLNDATGSEHSLSATSNMRLKSCPPFVEMRVVHPPPPPTMTVDGASACTRVRSTEVPVVRPLQVCPASDVARAVPPSPTAYPTPPENAIALSVLPCGVGFPHAHPDLLTFTFAELATASAVTPNTHAAAAATAVRPAMSLPTRRGIVSSSECGDWWCSAAAVRAV